MNQPSQPPTTPIMLFDGNSVSNPGVAAAAAILLLPNGRRYTVSQFLSLATNAEAEYTGLLIGLKKARQLGLKVLEIKGDSELVFNQVNGLSPTVDKNVQILYQEVKKLMATFDRVNLECIAPEQNRPAAAAVNRCIGEALGRDADLSGSRERPIHPDIARLTKLGANATDRDYRSLKAQFDDLTLKSLAELRELVSESVRDTIALGWDGNDLHLAELYRWYLRGLPPGMALKKVGIDNPQTMDNRGKLPWEGALAGSTIPESNGGVIETSEPFMSAPIFEMLPEKPPAAPETNVKTPDRQFLLPINERETLLSAPSEDEDKNSIDPIEATDNLDVGRVLELLNGLSINERELLINNLLDSPDWVNLVLQSIGLRLNISKVKV